jgi:hypothetical protein
MNQNISTHHDRWLNDVQFALGVAVVVSGAAVLLDQLIQLFA